MTARLRKAKMDDAMDIFLWRNDESTRRNSFSKNIIDYDSHLKWLEGKLSDPSCLMFILEDDERKVGNIRIDIDNKEGEISYMIAPDSRGKGYGKLILSLVEKTLPQDVKTLTALVLKDNAASGKCFLTNGYQVSDYGEVLRYHKDIG